MLRGAGDSVAWSRARVLTNMCEVWLRPHERVQGAYPGHAPRKRANAPLCHARWSAVLPRVPYPEHEDCGGRIGVCGFDFEMDFVSPAQAHPLVNLAGRRAVVPVQFFPEPVVVVLTQLLRFGQQCLNHPSRHCDVVVKLDVVSDLSE